MSILYAAVGIRKAIHAEHPERSHPELASVCARIVSQLPANENRRKTFEEPGHKFHCISSCGLVVICAAQQDAPLARCYKFLEALQRMLSPDLQNAKKILVEQLAFFNNPANDKVENLKNELSQVTEVMASNIENVLKRGEDLQNMAEKSDELAEGAQRFNSQARRLRRATCMKHAKLIALIVLVVFVLIIILVFSICNVNFSRCT